MWLCRTADAGSLDKSVLSAEELARYGNREDAILGRVLLRHLLAEYAAESAGEWRFATGIHGKPELVEPSRPLQFNLSHSGQWLAVAVALEVPVGVDVQVIDRERRVERLARRYFSKPELADLERLDGDDYLRHFYRLWSLKEACTKARGGALPTALGDTGFRLGEGGLESLAPEKTASSSLWLQDLAGYSLALCGLASGLELATRLWTSAGPGEAPEASGCWSLGAS